MVGRWLSGNAAAQSTLETLHQSRVSHLGVIDPLGSVLFASVSFLYGYFAQSSKTPQIMAVAYGIMAVVCIIETFGYMTSKTKYLAMGGEFLAYAVILLLLFRSRYFIAFFQQV